MYVLECGTLFYLHVEYYFFRVLSDFYRRRISTFIWSSCNGTASCPNSSYRSDEAYKCKINLYFIIYLLISVSKHVDKCTFKMRWIDKINRSITLLVYKKICVILNIIMYFVDQICFQKKMNANQVTADSDQR